LVENTYKNPEGNPMIFDMILLDKVKSEGNSGKALDVNGASMANGAPLAQWQFWNQAQNQVFTLSPNTFG
jgi:hypothetical protein